MRLTSSRRVLAGLATLVVAWGCGYRLDTERRPDERGTLGEEIHRILAIDLDRSQPAKGEAFRRERARFVCAFDTAMPEELLDDLQQFFVDILPLYDQGILPGVLRPTACMLDALSRETGLLEALWFVARPEGYGLGQLPVTRRVLVHPGIDDLLTDLARLWLDHDGLDAGLAPDPDEDDTFSMLLAELARAMREAEPAEPGGETTAEALVDFALSEDARLLDPAAPASWVVRTDRRGRARVAPDPLSGQLPAPFCDGDADGLADIHPQSGDFVDCHGLAIDAPPPFGPDGSRPRSGDRLVYRYSDLGQSMLVALVDQLVPLVEDDFVWELPDALPALLGPLGARADQEGVYPGYEPDAAPAVALVHALRALVDYERLPELLEALLTVLELHEHQLARLLHEVDRVEQIADAWPDCSLAGHNRLADDLIPRLLEMAERGYLGPFLRSFADPRAMSLQSATADMIRYRDILDDDDMTLREPTDFALSDEEYIHRSNLQKMMHLTHDTNGAEHATEVVGYDVFVIEDMLVFWLDSIARLAEVPWYVRVAVTEFSSEHPTTEEVNRFMNHDHDILGNPVGREGNELYRFNAEALLAMEACGLLEALRPGFEAVVTRDRDRERTGTKVLADLLAAVHPHWSPNTPPYVSEACANVRAVEPVLLDVLDNTDLLRAAVDLLGSLAERTTPSGLRVVDELDLFTRHLLRFDGALSRHDGRDWVLGADESTRIVPFSRFYLLLDALRVVDDAVAGDPDAEAALERAAELLSDRFLEVEEIDGVWRFQNRRAWTLLLNLVSFLREQAADHAAAGTLSSRLAELEDDLRDGVGGRVVPRLVQALQLVAGHPRLPAAVDGLVLDLLAPPATEEQQELWLNLARLVQVLLVDRVTVPAAHFLGRHLDPEAPGWQAVPGQGCAAVDQPVRLVSRVLDLLVRMSEAGPNDVFASLLANLGTVGPGADSFPLDDFGEVICAVHREDPSGQDTLTAADAARILQEVSAYLLDDQRGIEKLYQQVERRNGF